MLPSSVCSTPTPMNSQSRPPLPTSTGKSNVLKEDIANSSPTGLTPQSKRLYFQISHRVVCPLLPTLCTSLGIYNVQDNLPPQMSQLPPHILRNTLTCPHVSILLHEVLVHYKAGKPISVHQVFKSQHH